MNNKRKKSPISSNDKRAWAAPKVAKRANVDRTQGGASVAGVELGGYYRPS